MLLADTLLKPSEMCTMLCQQIVIYYIKTKTFIELLYKINIKFAIMLKFQENSSLACVILVNYIYGYKRTHTLTQTHTLCICEKQGHPIGVMVFILYKLYVSLPYTYT